MHLFVIFGRMNVVLMFDIFARTKSPAIGDLNILYRYLDGGLIGNNPTLDVLTELTEMNLALRGTGQHEEASKTNLKVVVSCGTG